MIPRPGLALRDLAMKLAVSIAPQTQSAYTASNAGMIAMLMNCLAQEFDRGAQVRSEDLDEVAALLDDLPAALERELATDIAAFRNSAPASLRIEDLSTRHANAMALLIRLHSWVEEHQDRERDRAIWAFLTRHADRHAFDVML